MSVKEKQMKRIFLGFLVFSLSAVLWAKSVDVALYSQVFGYRSVSNEVFQQKEYTTGETAARVQVFPEFSYGENVQIDGLIDLYVGRRYDTNVFVATLKEAYIDMLFWDALSLRSGYFVLDYGYNGLFHPLALVHFDPEIQKVGARVLVGTEEHGYRGLPAARLRYSFRLGEDVRMSLEQATLWTEPTNFLSNYYLSAVSVTYREVNAGTVSGYRWGTHVKPVWGWYASARLPGDVLVFGEVFWRRGWGRLRVSNDQIVEYLPSDGSWHGSLELHSRWQEPLWRNTVDLRGEYLYTGDGLSLSRYDELYRFVRDPANVMLYGMDVVFGLVDPYRTLMHTFVGEVGYTIVPWQVSVKYTLLTVTEGVWLAHSVGLVKNYPSATLGFSLTYHAVTEEKYRLFSGGNEWQWGCQFQMSM